MKLTHTVYHNTCGDMICVSWVPMINMTDVSPYRYNSSFLTTYTAGVLVLILCPLSFIILGWIESAEMHDGVKLQNNVG